MPEDEDKSRSTTGKWISRFAGVATVLLVIIGIYCALAPYLQFHTRTPNAYSELRDASSILLLASIVAANIWFWSAVGPRIDPTSPYGVLRLIGVILGTLVASALAAGILFYTLIVISLATTDWFTF